jgi:hypothetical protein
MRSSMTRAPSVSTRRSGRQVRPWSRQCSITAGPLSRSPASSFARSQTFTRSNFVAPYHRAAFDP